MLSRVKAITCIYEGIPPDRMPVLPPLQTG